MMTIINAWSSILFQLWIPKLTETRERFLSYDLKALISVYQHQVGIKLSNL